VSPELTQAPGMTPSQVSPSRHLETQPLPPMWHCPRQGAAGWGLGVVVWELAVLLPLCQLACRDQVVLASQLAMQMLQE